MTHSSFITSYFWSLNLLLIVLGGSLQSAETGTWSSPTTLGPSTGCWPQVAMDAQGNAVAMWLQDLNVCAATKVNGGTWTQAKTLFTASDGIMYLSVGVSLDLEGNALAIWETYASDSSTIYAAFLPINETEWKSLPNPFPTQPGYSQTPVQTAFAPDGTALIVRGGYINNTSCLQAVRFEASSGSFTWTSFKDLEVSFAMFSQLAIDSQGNALVVWSDWNKKTQYFINSAKVLKGDTEWSQIMSVSPPLTMGFCPTLAGDSAGNAVVLWMPVSVKKVPAINASILPSGAKQWDALPSPVTAEEQAEFFNLILDGNNNVIAIWHKTVQDCSLNEVQASTLSFTSTKPQWNAPVTLYSDIPSVNPPLLAVDTHCNVLAIWETTVDGTKGILQGALKPSGQDWTSTFTIAAADFNIGTPALSPLGTAEVVFLAKPLIQAVTGTNLFKLNGS